MSSRATISVIIPNYNHADYLERALGAIFSQSRAPDEVIVVDDASTDHSLEVLSRYEKAYPLRIVRHLTNQGVAAAVNRGVAESKGDYLYLTSADDRALPGLIEKSMAILEAYPAAGLCCSHPAFLEGPEATLNTHDDWQRFSENACYFSPQKLFSFVGPSDFWIAGHTTIVKRSSYDAAGGLLSELKWNCDWFMVHVIAFRDGVCYVPEALAALRIDDTTYSGRGRQNFEGQANILWAMAHLLMSEPYSDVREMFCRSRLFNNFPLHKKYILAFLKSWKEFVHPRRNVGVRGFARRTAKFGLRVLRFFRGKWRKFLYSNRERHPLLFKIGYLPTKLRQNLR